MDFILSKVKRAITCQRCKVDIKAGQESILFEYRHKGLQLKQRFCRSCGAIFALEAKHLIEKFLGSLKGKA